MAPILLFYITANSCDYIVYTHTHTIKSELIAMHRAVLAGDYPYKYGRYPQSWSYTDRLRLIVLIVPLIELKYMLLLYNMGYWINFYQLLVNFVFKFVNRCIYMKGRLVEHRRISNAKNLAISVIDNCLLVIDNRKLPARD